MGICLVTGANGFIGRSLCDYLIEQGLKVRGTVRKKFSLITPSKVEFWESGDIHKDTDWSEALQNVDIIFHLAGTVHRPDITDPLIYQTTIPEATASLAYQAAQVGVKRLIYISSSNIYGLAHDLKHITESVSPKPFTFYDFAKLAAENILQQFSKHSSLEIVIIRPPLIYGSGVKGNFMQLLKLVNKFPILPFGKATQKRSFIGIDNFIHFLYFCACHEKAANKIFNVSDDVDMSTQELCEAFANLLNKKRLLLPIPSQWMRYGLKVLGKENFYYKLFGPQRLDISLAKKVLHWHPPFTFHEQLQKVL